MIGLDGPGDRPKSPQSSKRLNGPALDGTGRWEVGRLSGDSGDNVSLRKQIIKTEIVLCRISDKYFGDRESGASEWAACRDRDSQSDSDAAAQWPGN